MKEGSTEDSPQSSQVNVESLAKLLARFYSGRDEARKKVEQYLQKNPEATKQEVFQNLSAGRGTPTSHASTGGDSDGLRPQSKNTQPKRKWRSRY